MWILLRERSFPRDDLSNLLSTNGGIGFSYYYRPIRWLAAEAGYETLFGAAEIREWVQTGYGNLRIRDYQQFLPFGGRVILPLANERIQIYGGGGGAYIRYSERLSQPPYYGYRFECPDCALGWPWLLRGGRSYCRARPCPDVSRRRGHEGLPWGGYQ